jgi:hypothetical protein
MSCTPPQWLVEHSPTKQTETTVTPSTVVLAINGWLSPRRPKEQRREQRPHLTCPPPQRLDEHTPTNKQRPEQRPQLACPWRARQLSGWLSPFQPREQRPEQRPHWSCTPSQWLAEPSQSELTEARESPSPVVSAYTVSGLAHAVRATRGHSSAFTCRALHHSDWLSPRRTNVQRPEQRPHLSGPTIQWLAGPTPTKRTEAKTASSPVMPPLQGIGEPTPTERTVATAASSPVVPATTGAG